MFATWSCFEGQSCVMSFLHICFISWQSRPGNWFLPLRGLVWCSFWNRKYKGRPTLLVNSLCFDNSTLLISFKSSWDFSLGRVVLLWNQTGANQHKCSLNSSVSRTLSKNHFFLIRNHFFLLWWILFCLILIRTPPPGQKDVTWEG